MKPYHREDHLKNQFNTFIEKKITHKQHDYYSALSDSDLEEFKSLLSQINNIFTIRTTNLFLKWIGDKFCLPNDKIQTYLDTINTIKPNSNGFDVRLDDIKVLAEIKCNKPFLKTSFGSAQKNGILKDIIGLLNGKTKENITTSEYIKFLVIYDFGISVHNAVYTLLRNLKSPLSEKVFLYNSEMKLNKNYVYILILKP